MNYSRYKKNKKKDNKKSLYSFLAIFCVTLLVCIGLAKVLSPDVDINLGNDTDYEAKDTGLGVKKFIDNRLKMIQSDDNGQELYGGKSSQQENKKQKDYNDASFDNYSTSQMNVKVKTSSTSRNSDSLTDDMDLDSPSYPQQTQPARAPQRVQPRVSAPITTSHSKVYVGSYATAQQAHVAQGIIQDAGLGVNPVVVNSGNGYTLKVGSYSSRSRADGVASELQRNNFPARVEQ